LIIIPFDAAAKYGSKSIIKVCGTIDLVSFRSIVFPVGDSSHCMTVNKEILKIINKNCGDTVFVQIKADTEPRDLVIPDRFRTAMEQNPNAMKRFEELSDSHKMEILEWIYGAINAEIKETRLLNAVERLSFGTL
jgi:hypothetical protein